LGSRQFRSELAMTFRSSREFRLSEWNIVGMISQRLGVVSIYQ
jgi:hypothetical protein